MTPRDFNPRPYQGQMIAHGLKHPRCAFWAGMGMGKTSAALCVIDTLLLAGAVSKALVIAPLRVARTTWPEECRKWTQLQHLRVSAVVGTDAERRAALAADADIYTINFENIQWLVNSLGDAWAFDMVVCDEATKVKATRLVQGSKRGRALAQVAFSHVKRWINLTGTPAPNGLQDLWGQTYFLDQGQRLGRSYSDFENRWFGFQRAKDAASNGKTYVKRIAFPHAQPEIQGLLKDICLTLDPKDWFPIDEPTVTDVYVDLPKEARAIYKAMEREMFAEIQGYGVEAFGAAAKTIKCLQLANGACYTGSDEAIQKDAAHWVDVHDEKLDALQSIIDESGGVPILVAYHFKPDLARLLKRFPQARHIKTKADEAAFKAKQIPIGLVHAQSVGHGVDGFQNVTNIMVFFAHWWAMEDRVQLIERIGPVRQIQSGHTTIEGRNRPVFLYNIVARNTVDEVVLERYATKRSVQDLLMSYMKQQGVEDESDPW